MLKKVSPVHHSPTSDAELVFETTEDGLVTNLFDEMPIDISDDLLGQEAFTKLGLSEKEILEANWFANKADELTPEKLKEVVQLVQTVQTEASRAEITDIVENKGKMKQMMNAFIEQMQSIADDIKGLVQDTTGKVSAVLPAMGVFGVASLMAGEAMASSPLDTIIPEHKIPIILMSMVLLSHKDIKEQGRWMLYALPLIPLINKVSDFNINIGALHTLNKSILMPWLIAVILLNFKRVVDVISMALFFLPTSLILKPLVMATDAVTSSIKKIAQTNIIKEWTIEEILASTTGVAILNQVIMTNAFKKGGFSNFNNGFIEGFKGSFDTWDYALIAISSITLYQIANTIDNKFLGDKMKNIDLETFKQLFSSLKRGADDLDDDYHDDESRDGEEDYEDEDRPDIPYTSDEITHFVLKDLY